MSNKVAKIRYQHDELSAILIALRGYLKENTNPEYTLDQLCNEIINKLSIRIAKRLLENKERYSFNFSIEERLVFIFIYEERITVFSDTWTANLMLQTFNKLYESTL